MGHHYEKGLFHHDHSRAAKITKILVSKANETSDVKHATELGIHMYPINYSACHWLSKKGGRLMWGNIKN